MIFLGPSVELAAYNAWLGQPGPDRQPPMLEGRLDRYVGAATGGRVADDSPVPVIQWVDTAHPMFAGYYPSLAPYRRVQVYRHAVVHLPTGSANIASRVIARLDNNDPLVIETPYGRGRVLLFTTAANTRWTSWPRQAQALAVRQMMLAAGQPGNRGAALREHQENDQVAVELPAATVGDQGSGIGDQGSASPRHSSPVVKVEFRLPDGKRVEAALQAALGGARSVVPVGVRASAWLYTTDQLGSYTWRASNADGRALAEGGFAVNVPEAESNLATMDPARLVRILSVSGEGPAAGAALEDSRGGQQGGQPGRVVLVADSADQLAEKIEGLRKGSPLWPFLFAAVLVLLAVEAKIANRSRPAALPAAQPAAQPAAL
jgi:hypothetical protein